MADTPYDIGVKKVEIGSSTIMQPVDIQSHLATTIQTHNAVSVAASSSSAATSWVDCNGYNYVRLTMLVDAGVTNSADIQWSNDGTTLQGKNSGVISSSTSQYRATDTPHEVPIKARYMRVVVNNGDTVSHTISAWAYLIA